MNTALPDRARSTLHLVAIGVVLVAAFQACIGWFRDKVLLFLVTRMAVSAERGVLQHLLRLPFPVLDKMTVGERLQAFNGVGGGTRASLAERAARRGARRRDGRSRSSSRWRRRCRAATLVVVIVARLDGRSSPSSSAPPRLATRRERSRRRRASAASSPSSSPASGRSRLPGRSGRRSSGGCGASGRSSPTRCGASGSASGATWASRRCGRALYVALLVWGGSLILRGELLVGTLLAFVQLSTGFLGAVFGLVRVHLHARRPPAAARQDAGDPEGRAGEARRRAARSPGARSVPVRDGGRLVPPRPGGPVDREGLLDALRGGREGGHHRPLRLREEHDPAHARGALRPGGGVDQHRRDEPAGGRRATSCTCRSS